MLATELLMQLADFINQYGDQPVIMSNGKDRDVDTVEFNEDDEDPAFVLGGEERDEDDS